MKVLFNILTEKNDFGAVLNVTVDEYYLLRSLNQKLTASFEDDQDVEEKLTSFVNFIPTKDTILNDIADCSGVCGIDNFKTMQKSEFIKWFANDILYNTEESKQVGLKVIKKLEEGKVY